MWADKLVYRLVQPSLRVGSLINNMWLEHRCVRETIDETCITDFVWFIIGEPNEIFLLEESICISFFNNSMMYMALGQS